MFDTTMETWGASVWIALAILTDTPAEPFTIPSDNPNPIGLI